MNRISGLEKNEAPWHLRWFYTAMRKMFGKDLTPVKQQRRVPGLVWGSIAMEEGLAKKRRLLLVLNALFLLRLWCSYWCRWANHVAIRLELGSDLSCRKPARTHRTFKSLGAFACGEATIAVR